MAPTSIVSTLKLNSGFAIPAVAYGLYQTPPDVTKNLVSQALVAGYRHLDSATMYANEAATGKAIRESGIPRSEIFYTSKAPPKSVNYEETTKSINLSLKEAGLDYIDLYMLHTPFGGKVARLAAWKALVDAKAQGKIRSIGISNYGLHHLQELEAYIAEVDKAEGKGKGGQIDVGQWEIHPWLARKDITDWCQERGIIIEAYSPLVRGTRMQDPLLQPLVAKYGKSPAQILLRWSLQKGFVPLPKSETPARIIENTEVFDFELSEEDLKTLDTGKYEPCMWDPTRSQD